MKTIQLTNAKLKINKEKVAKLSDQDMRSLYGGGSTCSSLTCTWCTSTQSSSSTPTEQVQ